MRWTWMTEGPGSPWPVVVASLNLFSLDHHDFSRDRVPAGNNYGQPVIVVAHATLEKWRQDSPFRVGCPVCGGLLLVRRDQATFQLMRDDLCVRCGQRFHYTDTMIGGELLPPEEVA